MVSSRKTSRTNGTIKNSSETQNLLNVENDEEDPSKYSKHRNYVKKRNQRFFLLFCFACVIAMIIHRANTSTNTSTRELKDTKKVLHTAVPHQKPPRKKHRWVDPRLLPPLPGEDMGTSLMMETLFSALDKNPKRKKRGQARPRERQGFRVSYSDRELEWEAAADAYESNTEARQGPLVDYTTWKYEYPELIYEPPSDGSYPPLEPLGEVLQKWPQDAIDNPPSVFKEQLLHFDYMDLEEREAAVLFRNHEFPFKVYNVPELAAANLKWTDEYLSSHFDRFSPKIHGTVQESEDSFFSFFRPENWNIEVMGPPPSIDTDLSFKKWSKHARYADNVGLKPNEIHYYFQSGVPKQERHSPKKKWSFVSIDLPSFSDPKPTFFGFNPPEQKGIQCRFGERGVTAATHYDAGRNMVAMITGAKRYILAPPKACPELGIISENRHPAFRHSLLNFAHLNLMQENTEEILEMSEQERSWLDISNDSLSIDTVLKAGEVLYIPSHWFHYITSLQKSAQCNTRSGRNHEGSAEFGGFQEIHKCVGDNA